MIQDVHTRHCCILHGCKYGDDDCTVTNKVADQEYICESCNDDNVLNIKTAKILSSKKSYRREIISTDKKFMDDLSEFIDRYKHTDADNNVTAVIVGEKRY